MKLSFKTEQRLMAFAIFAVAVAAITSISMIDWGVMLKQVTMTTETLFVIALICVGLNVIFALIKICNGYNRDRLQAFLGWLLALVLLIANHSMTGL